jgi:predicted N-acetyltransferase YhbS
MAKMRNPGRDKFDEVFDLLEKVFRYETVGYDVAHVREWLDVIDASDILVMEEDGNIVSNVLIEPYRLYVRGSILEGAEVGAVATDEGYRGRGFASALLQESLRLMTERGYDISTLGGYRDRYARWGWEQGGAVRTYSINGRSIRRAGDHNDVALGKYVPPDAAMRKAMIEAYEGNEAHVIRPEIQQRLTYDASMYSGTEVWVANRPGGKFAYAMVRRASGGKSVTVLEYGGHPQTLALCLRRAFEEWDLHELTIPSPTWHTDFTPVLERMSEGWSVSPVRQINIINLEGCLRKLLPGAGERAEDILRMLSGEYSVTLGVSDTGQRATISFDRGCSLADGAGDEELSLDRCTMVRLLFGPDKPSDTVEIGKRMASYLDLIFPLPFFEWETDMR